MMMCSKFQIPNRVKVNMYIKFCMNSGVDHYPYNAFMWVVVAQMLQTIYNDEEE